MKKTWNNPGLEKLEITATAGGMNNPHIVDSDKYENGDKYTDEWGTISE